MNLKKFIANTLGDISIELAHAMGQAFRAKFMEFFEDQDGDGVYKLRSNKVQLTEDCEPVSMADLSSHVINAMAPEELEFELETPIHFTDDTDEDGDIEVSLTRTGLFKDKSYLKIRMLLKKTPAPEGFNLVRDKTNMNLYRELEGHNSERPTSESE